MRKEINQIDSQIQLLYDNNLGGTMVGEDCEELKILDQRRNIILEVEESLWRLTS